MSCADPEIFMRGGPTKMAVFVHRRGGVQSPKKSRNYLFLGKIFKFQGGGGGAVPPPSGSAHVCTHEPFTGFELYCIRPECI